MTPREIMDKIGDGMILRVASEGAALVEFERIRYPEAYPGMEKREPIPVSAEDLQQALAVWDGLGKLTELGNPPPNERPKYGGWKMGWREMGLDGDKADYYLLVQ